MSKNSKQRRIAGARGVTTPRTEKLHKKVNTWYNQKKSPQ